MALRPFLRPLPVLALALASPVAARPDASRISAPVVAADAEGHGSIAAGIEHLSIPFEKYVLKSNGLEVILSPDHALPLVAVNVWYHVGPVNESPGRTGFAHLFEHLMFQGSRHVGDDQHFKLLESRGASLINGTTSFDRTNYFETVPASELQLALWLESDRMGFLRDAIGQASLDNQRQVVMNERRQSIENAPYGPSGEKLVQSMLPPEHPYYGYVMGSMADLSAATLADVHAFYDRYYAPANATLVVAGAFDVAQAKAWIARYFGTLPRREVPAPRQVTTPPITAQRRAVVHEKVRLAQVSKGWLSAPVYAPGDADADVLAELLGGGKSSRLYRHLVYELELAQDVGATQQSMALTGSFLVNATARPGVDVGKLEAELDRVLASVQTEPPTEREVARAKNQLKTALVSGMQSLGGFGGRADMLNRYNHYLRDPGYLAADLRRYDAVTPESVRALAQQLLVSTQCAVVVTVPEK